MRRRLRGNVLWLSVVSLLTDLSSEMIYPLLPFFLVTRLGAGAAFLGLVEGIAESTASLTKLWSGWLSDRAGRRKPLVAVGYGLAGFVRPLVAVATAPWHVLAIRFSDRVGKGIRTAPRDALLAASVPEQERGRAFGVHRAADHAGAVLGPLVALGLLLLFPGQLRLVFALALVPGVVAFVLVLTRVRETDVEVQAKPAQRAGGGLQSFATPLSPRLRRFLIVVVLFTLGNASDAFLLLRAQQLGVSLALLPLLWAVLHVSKATWNLAGGALADRAGAGGTIVAGWVVYALVYVGFAFAGAEWHAWMLFIVYGVFYGLTEAPEKALVAGLSPAERRGTAFGAYHMAIGLAALPASLIFGAVWQYAGVTQAFLLSASLALAAALVLPLALRGPRVASLHGTP